MEPAPLPVHPHRGQEISNHTAEHNQLPLCPPASPGGHRLPSACHHLVEDVSCRSNAGSDGDESDTDSSGDGNSDDGGVYAPYRDDPDDDDFTFGSDSDPSDEDGEFDDNDEFSDLDLDVPDHGHCGDLGDGFDESESDMSDPENGEIEDDDADIVPSAFIDWAKENNIDVLTVSDLHYANLLQFTAEEDEDITRLKTRILELVRALALWCRTFGTVDDFRRLGRNRPLTDHWFKVLLDASTDDVATLDRDILDAIPAAVKITLGQEEITVHDLMQLPRLGLDCTDFGCYLSIAATPNTDVHLYIGSSCDEQEGRCGRMKKHFHSINGLRFPRKSHTTRRCKPFKPSHHHTVAARHGTIPHFILAQLPRLAANIFLARFIEG